MNDVWTDLHKSYSEKDWINKPSLFAETAITYFPKTGKVLDLGAGQGQDSRFFAEHGYEVVSTDLEQSALDLGKAKISSDIQDKITQQIVDLREELPFERGEFDVVYAHLSLHYFDAETTRRLSHQIRNVLKPGGIFAFFTNSTSDPEYGTGTRLEDDYFQIGGTAKRYFSVRTAREFAQYFEITLLDDHGETYKDADKGVHNLIRFIGTNPGKTIYKLAVPFTGAIVERDGPDGEKEVLLQTRWQPAGDPVYSGTLEFPVGKLDVPYENVFDTVAREVREETGLTLKSIRGEDKTQVYDGKKDDAAIGFRPFCCTQQLKSGRPWIGFIFVVTVGPGKPHAQLSESRDVKWVKLTKVRQIFETSPEKLFTLELPAWEYYFNNA